MNTKILRIYLLMLLIFISCSKDDKNFKSTVDTPLFSLLISSQTGIDFENTHTETEKNNIITYEYIYNDGGVAVGDLNNDGLADIYLSGNQVKNKLFFNKGDLKFEDVTVKTQINEKDGWKTGTTIS